MKHHIVDELMGKTGTKKVEVKKVSCSYANNEQSGYRLIEFPRMPVIEQPLRRVRVKRRQVSKDFQETLTQLAEKYLPLQEMPNWSSRLDDMQYTLQEASCLLIELMKRKLAEQEKRAQEAKARLH